VYSVPPQNVSPPHVSALLVTLKFMFCNNSDGEKQSSHMYFTSLTIKVAKGCSHNKHCSDYLQSVVGPSTFLDLGSGMDCPKTLFRR